MEALPAPEPLLHPETRYREAFRRTIHRANNFLSVVATRAEIALARNDADLKTRALEAILAEARKLEEFLRATRNEAGPSA